jgi:hypothetical protein
MRAFCIFPPAKMKRYYQILGLEEGASKEEVKKAYRQMAMKYHPDVNPGEGARQKFLEIIEAYEYLTGIRKMNQGKGMSAEDLEKFYDLMKKAAEEKAKARYRQRVRQFRKEQEKKQSAEFQKAILIIIGIVVVGISGWLGFRFYKNLVIDRDPLITEAQITGLGTKRMEYQFFLGDTLIHERVYASQYGIEIISGNGMPLKIGDKFELVYSQSRPSFHKINFEKVGFETMRRYLDLVSRRFLTIYKEEWAGISEYDRKIRAGCMALLVFNRFGFDGLSTVYYKDVNPLDNFSHNSWSWSNLSSDEEFLKIEMSCASDSMKIGQ